MNMRSFRIVAPLLGAALVAVAVVPRVAPSSAGAEPIVADTGPVAHAAGGDAAPLPLPSIVNVRVIRTEAALVRAATMVDQGHSGPAANQLNSAVLNMQKAWTAAQYVVKTAPPPPPAEAGGVRAHASGGAVGPPTATATPEDTAFAVHTLQHEVVTTAMGLINGPDAVLAPAIANAISTAMTARDAAIKYIHSIAPPPPPAESGGVRAHASGGAVVGSTWDTVMPNLVPLLDDEIQQAAGTKLAVPTSPIDLQKVRARATATKKTVNQFWPPVPPSG
jgi:hypothetical protein